MNRTTQSPPQPSPTPAAPANSVASPQAPHAPMQPGPVPGMPPAPGVPGVPGAPGAQAQGVFMTEEQYQQSLMKESKTPHVVVALVGTGLALAVWAMKGFADGGVAIALAMAIVAIVMLAVSIGTGTLAAWVVGKLFAADFGTLPVLLLRVAALSGAEMVALGGLSMVIGGFMTMVLGLPILVGLAIWLLGMDVLQAFVFSVVLKIVELMLLSFIMMSFAASLAG